MKRIFALAAVVLLLLTLAGCGKAEPLATGESGQSYSAHEDVQIQILDIYRDETGLAIEVEWSNRGSKEVIFGASYEIQRKEGAEWVACPGQYEAVFPAIAYMLPSKDSRKEIYHPEWFFDLSKPGTYRFISNCTLEEVDRIEVWAEFSLDKPEKNAQADYLWKKPPELKLTCGETVTQVSYAGCSWFCLQENGMMAATEADPIDPMMAQNSFPEIVADFSHFRISFDAAPDQWSAECWPAEDWAEGTADSHSVQLAEDGFLARPGKWVYVIRGAWEDKGAGWYGTAEYYFVIETETGNVNGLAR